MFSAFFLSLPLLATSPLEMESMLFQAEQLSELYAPLVAKAPPPKKAPQSEALLSFASNWFSIDLSSVKTDGRSALAYLAQEPLWDALAEIGIRAVELKGLKGCNAPIARFEIDPKFGSEQEYGQLATLAMKKGVRLIGSVMGVSTGRGADFALALKNFGAYPSLYSLIEIEPQDWDLLPHVDRRTFTANIPWLSLQALHKMGYVPTDFDPYVKTSQWNATEEIRCMDNKVRRWIYLRDEGGFPRLDYLSPTFGALRLAAADSLYCMFRLGQPILQVDDAVGQTASETMSLAIRKLGGFSASMCQGGVRSFTKNRSDVMYDHLTPMAALHALIAEDAEVLRLMYRLLMEEKVPLKRLVHSLEPFGRFPCDWAEFLDSPKKKYQYYEEELTGEALRGRLMREDRFRIEGKMGGWSDGCKSILSVQDLEKKRALVTDLHLLLATFFACQPGPFCLSAQELIGAAPQEMSIDPFGPNRQSLYSGIPNQLKNPHSFASRLKAILRVREQAGIERADLIDAPTPEHKGVLLLSYRLPDSSLSALLAINFGKEETVETLESCKYVRTNAINLLTGLSEQKLFDSSFFTLKLEPLSAKLVVFQPKYVK